MSKLLKAGIWRLTHNKVFVSMIVLTVIVAITFIINSCINNFKYGVDNLIFSYINLIGFFIAIFTSLFVGSEYDYGTIRNKIVVGHSRVSIYISTLIINIVVAIFLELIYILVTMLIGIPILGEFTLTISQIITTLLYLVVTIIGYTSIFTFVTLICSEITLSTVINIVLILVMFVSTQFLIQVVNAREYSYSTSYGENGEIISQEIIGKNPNYPGENVKEICKRILYTIPTGQADIILNNMENTDKQILLYSTGMSVAISLLGIITFNKKELK